MFVIAIIISYFLFKNSHIAGFISSFGDLGYLGVLIAGIFLAFGFTAPLSVGFFITFSAENIWIAAVIGALGALLADLLIFNLIKVSFMDEFRRIEHTKIAKETSYLLEASFGHKIKIYLMYLFAELLIASPLPDEAGITMLAGLTKIRQSVLGIMSFSMHFIGILVLLNI